MLPKLPSVLSIAYLMIQEGLAPDVVARAESAEDALFQAYATNARLHRRVQQAESTAEYWQRRYRDIVEKALLCR